jgi:serine/threonine protein kinase
MSSVRTANDEPIPGYRLLEPLGKGGFGEVWKCQAPGGLTKAVKFVPGSQGLETTASEAEQELRALEHIKSLRHPFLLSIERVEVVRGDLVLVTELADRSLHDLLTDYLKSGHAGIPRDETLAYLREAAEVLDVLNQEHGLQHLDIKPRNLFLVHRHVKVADFGLVASLADIYSRGALLNGITPLYAAPEIFEGRATLFSDQYSLAVTYHELVTGEPPYKAKNSAQLSYLVATSEPDLSRLASHDRDIVRRALSKDSRKRFGSCTEFIDALLDADPATTPAPAPTTSYDISIGEADRTAVVPAVKRSGVFRRESRMVPAVGASTDQLAGYKLLECLGRGPAGELWRAQGPRKDSRLVRFLAAPGEDSPAAGALERLVALTHPGLAEMKLHQLTPERVALVSEAGQSSLASRLRDCRAAGQPGVPRVELLAYLGAVSQTLDELYHEHQLQHLALSPRHLAVSHGEAILIEFGLAELLWLPQGVQPAAVSHRYSAVELFDSLVSDACDQYSLALMFQELLVGLHPFRNLNARQMASPKLRGQPDLSLLPAPDRAVVAAALDPDPAKRFRSCAEFVLALSEATPRVEQGTVVVPAGLQPAATHGTALAARHPAAPEWRGAVEELVQSAGRGHQILSQGQLHYRLQPGHSIEQRAVARLAPGMARLKLKAFREQWNAETVSRTDSAIVMEIRTKPSMLQGLLGRSPGVQVEVVLGAPRDASTHLTPVRVLIQPVDCGRGRAEQVLTEFGPVVLGSLLSFLSAQCDRAMQERYPIRQAVEVAAPSAGLTVRGETRDIGLGGLSFQTDTAVPAGAVTVQINRWASPATVKIPGRVRDCREVEGRYEVEVEYGA